MFYYSAIEGSTPGPGSVARVMISGYDLVYRLLNPLSFAAGQLAVFSRRERRACIWIIPVERATRKNSQLAAARRVVLKMGRLLRCSSIMYRSR
jgi:hypothetical protein